MAYLDVNRRLLATQSPTHRAACDQNAAMIRELFATAGVPVTDDTLAGFVLGVHMLAVTCGISRREVDAGNPLHVALHVAMGAVIGGAAAVQVKDGGSRG